MPIDLQQQCDWDAAAHVFWVSRVFIVQRQRWLATGATTEPITARAGQALARRRLRFGAVGLAAVAFVPGDGDFSRLLGLAAGALFLVR